MMIVVAIVIALMSHNLKKGVYLINRWPRWQTDACVKNSLIVMKMLVEMRVVAVIGDGDQNQDKPGKLLQEGMGKRRRAGTRDSDSECFDFKRISLLFTLYFIALDFPYLLKHISQLDT